MSEPQIVRKSAFAVLRGVSPGRVSQWIAEGKISGKALVGVGQKAQINVAIATAQLRVHLDPNQRYGLNGITTNLDDDPAEQPELAAAPQPAQAAIAPAPVVDTVESRIKLEKLRQTELTTLRLEEDERTRRGTYVNAAEVKAGYNRLGAELVKTFESAMPNIADAIAAKFGAPARDVLHCMRIEFRKLRSLASEHYAAKAAELPESIEDDVKVSTLQ